MMDYIFTPNVVGMYTITFLFTLGHLVLQCIYILVKSVYGYGYEYDSTLQKYTPLLIIAITHTFMWVVLLTVGLVLGYIYSINLIFIYVLLTGAIMAVTIAIMINIGVN